MSNRQACKILSKSSGSVKQSVFKIESGLDERTTESMYKKLKNAGKCCEGGSEGWTG